MATGDDAIFSPVQWRRISHEIPTDRSSIDKRPQRTPEIGYKQSVGALLDHEVVPGEPEWLLVLE